MFSTLFLMPEHCELHSIIDLSCKDFVPLGKILTPKIEARRHWVLVGNLHLVQALDCFTELHRTAGPCDTGPLDKPVL